MLVEKYKSYQTDLRVAKISASFHYLILKINVNTLNHAINLVKKYSGINEW